MIIDRFEYYIYPHEVGANKRITPCNMGSLILNSAGMAATKNGFGMHYLHANGFAWVVSRMAVEMKEYPQEYQTITIETWMENCTAITSLRNYKIFNSEGELIGEASTLWSIIDFNSRKIVNLLKFEQLLDFVVDNHPTDIATAGRVDLPKNATPDNVFSHKVVYSDIDFNRHANSMKYLQWVIDSIPYETFMQRNIKRYEINYQKEVIAEEVVDIEHYICNDDGATTDIFDIKQEKTCCKIKLIYC